MKWEKFVNYIQDIDKNKNLGLGSFSFEDVRKIGRRIKSGSPDELKSPKDIVEELKRIDKMRLELDNSDWRKIEEDIKRMMRN